MRSSGGERVENAVRRDVSGYEDGERAGVEVFPDGGEGVGETASYDQAQWMRGLGMTKRHAMLSERSQKRHTSMFLSKRAVAGSFVTLRIRVSRSLPEQTAASST